jgi:hypothetical protein
LNDLAEIARLQGRYAEAEPLYKRSLEIAEKTAGANHSEVASSLNNLAALYLLQSRYADAEPLLRRSLEVNEKALGKDHPNVAISMNNLAMLYDKQNRFAEAERLYKQALAMTEKSLGQDHPELGITLGNLATIAYLQKDWKLAAEYWKRSTDIIVRRVQRNADDVGRAMTGKTKSESERSTDHFWGLIKAVHRSAPADRGLEATAGGDMFVTAQWALGSEAAASLAQMGARGAKGDPALAALIRERQDLVSEWQNRDASHTASVAKSNDQRDREAEKKNTDRLADIDARLAVIDSTLKVKFPDYAALSRLEPLSLAEVQDELRSDEALAFFLDMPRWHDTPEETYVWVVTKTQTRWVRLNNIGSSVLGSIVTDLRCGLDASLWDGDTCDRQIEGRPTRSRNGEVLWETLPFDVATANTLYKALFGQVEDLIRDKHLLIVPSGALTQIPFQVLVTDLPGGNAGLMERRVTKLGAELGELSQSAGKQVQQGVAVLRVVQGSAPERDGLKPGDVIVGVGDTDIGNPRQATDLFQARKPGDQVQLRVLRDNTQVTVMTRLGSGKVSDWVPKYIKVGAGAEPIQWLVRTHAVTVLPAVSSLKTLRRVAKPSAAAKPMLGIGNPLLEGDPRERPWEAEWARLASEKQACKGLAAVQLASVARRPRGAARVIMRGGHADLDHLRSQVPLPDTADELCAAAVALKLAPEDVLLAGNATETTIKRLSATGRLADYRVIHFATHGTLAGEIEKTSEPGLILTPPAEQTDTDDGYLSASEVATLKLDADWVILSACNTAAGGAANAEALSGLARAFIFAGTRALLVSHWAVNSAATVKLITSAVSSITRDGKMGRAEALRQAMLSMIDSGEPQEAHPALWAPFVVVGEGAPPR